MFRSSLLLFLLLPAAADEVILADGSRLSGTVTSLVDGGQVTLDSPLAFEPFHLLAEKIKRVDFSQPKGNDDDHDVLVVLANGDRFPGDLRAIDEKTIDVDTSFAGEIQIPRQAVNTVQLGVRPRKIIYRGPSNDSGWTVKSGWAHVGGRFVASGRGTLARDFDIPGSFSLRFRLAWRNSPNMQIYFADDSLATTGKADRYYLQFGGSGFELKRQQSGDGQRYLSMATVPRDPSEFANSSVEVELRVDRKLAIVHLYLDDEPEGKFADPMKIPPDGQGIMFSSIVGGDDVQYIDRIEVREWNASSDRHRNEERGDESRDVLITRNSDRGTGSILGLAPGENGGTIRYKGPHHPEPVDLAVSDVSTLFFARPAGHEPPPRPPLVLGLRGRGSLGVNGCEFDGGKIRAKHPLLGDLEIRRDAVASLQRGEEDPEETESEEP